MKQSMILMGVFVSLAASTPSQAKPYAEAKPLTLSQDKSTPLAGPLPTIKIVYPPDFEVIDQDASSKAMTIKLAVDHWNVAPKGQGIVFIIDNKTALEVHDLKKPINLKDVFHGDVDSGWHFLAVIPTQANGQSVRSAIAVSRFSIGKPNEALQKIKDHKDSPLLIVNLPLAGGFISHETGARLTLQAHPALDLTVWVPAGVKARTDCLALIASDELATNSNGEKLMRVKLSGVYYMNDLAAGNVEIPSIECPKFTAVWQVNDQNLINWNTLNMQFE